MPTHTTLKGSPQVGESLLSDQLEANLFSFVSWGLLSAGGYFNVRIPTSGAWGGDEHRLRPARDPRYQDGQVWQAYRRDWVWETGVDRVASEQPIRVSGVFVGGAFQPASATGAYKHVVDYPNGRVVFSSPVPTGTVVTCEYSPRLFQLFTADAPWWQQVQTRSFRADDPHFSQFGSGEWDQIAQNRVQLPAVVVEAASEAEVYGTQVGGGDTIVQDVLFHVLAEDRWHHKWMHDVLVRQFQKRFRLFDKNKLFSSPAHFPLDAEGSPAPSGKMYPDLVKPTGEGGFLWEQARVERVRSVQQPRPGGLHYCTVRASVGVDMPVA